MVFLCKFLYRNLKGYRLLVILAIVITVAQVSCDLLAAMPLKFIPSKVSNPGSDPACTFPFLDGILTYFDTPVLDPSLRPTQANQPPSQPPPAPCPASPSDINSVLHPRITQHSVIGVIVFSLIMLAIFGLLSALLVYCELFLATFIAQQLSARLRAELFDHLQRLSLDWHDKQKKGDLVQRITGNIADIEKLVTDGLVDLLAGTLTLIGVAVIMMLISTEYTFLALAIAPMLFIAVSGYTSSIKAAARKKAKAAGKIADVATEDINALTVIRAFTLEKRENQRFGRHVSTHRAAGLRAGRLQAQFTPIVSILVVLGTASVVGVGGYVAAGNGFSLGFFTISPSTIDVGTLILFLTYLKMLYQPMRDLSKLTNLASNASSGAERIQEVLDQAPEVIETTVPYEGPEKLRGDIVFEDVIFGYLKDRPVLKGISLSIPAGRKVALVGYSGSGKTTLAKLIPRFYEIRRGSIRIDGLDNRLYPLHVLRQNISMVLQDSVLFEGTVRENLEIGRPGASLEEVMDAAEKANIHHVIMNLPEGYDTLVREQGNNFSAGQRQRLAIARAILRDTPILILDEPTANLDVEAEAEVMRALNTLIAGRTVLTISHRLSTLGNVDEILVMQNGQLIEHGTFKELKHKGGLFASLLEEQNRYNLDRDEDESIVRSLRTATMPRLPAPPRSLPAASADDLLYSLERDDDDNTVRLPVVVGMSRMSRFESTPAIPTHSLHHRLDKDEDDAEDTTRLPLAATRPRLPAISRALSETSVHVLESAASMADEAIPATHAITHSSPSDPYKLSPTDLDPELLEHVLVVQRNGLGKLAVLSNRQHATPTRACIWVEVDGKRVSKHHLSKLTYTIGRFPGSDIQIVSQRVSRFHAIIHWKGGAWVIEDVESLNGLSCQGQRVDQLALVQGDCIHIDSSIVLRYEEEN